MADVPEAYYQFVMDYVPYTYVIPPSTPDPEWGRAAFAAAFAIDFLFEAYSAKQFEDRRTEINNKMADPASWILTQQCTDPEKLAYGGFKSNKTSRYYYSVDACRAIPSLLKAYELTNNTAFLDSAKLAGSTFLFNLQHKPAELSIHDKYYGGFARAVTVADAWLHQMDVEDAWFFGSVESLSFLEASALARVSVLVCSEERRLEEFSLVVAVLFLLWLVVSVFFGVSRVR